MYSVSESMELWRYINLSIIIIIIVVINLLTCSSEHASQIAAHININSTLDWNEYFLHLAPASLLPGNAVKQTGSSHVSVIGPDDDFVSASVSVVSY